MLTPLAPVPSFIQLTARALNSLRTLIAQFLSPAPAHELVDPALLQRWQRLEAVSAVLDLPLTPQELAGRLNTTVNFHLEDIGHLSLLCRRLHPTEGFFKFSLPAHRAVDGFLLCCIDEERQALHLLVVPNKEHQTYLRFTPQQAWEHAS